MGYFTDSSGVLTAASMDGVWKLTRLANGAENYLRVRDGVPVAMYSPYTSTVYPLTPFRTTYFASERDFTFHYLNGDPTLERGHLYIWLDLTLQADGSYSGQECLSINNERSDNCTPITLTRVE